VIIRDLIITPIAFSDPPLLNSDGVHEPLALRTIVQLVVDGGIVGLGEGVGGSVVLDRITSAREAVIGRSVFDLIGIENAISDVLLADEPGLAPRERRSVFSIIEVACHDVQGKIVGVPVSDLLGGAARDRVPYSAYLFYKWASHPNLVTGETVEADEWGEALDPAGIVRQAHQLIDRYGFRSIKLKAGVFPPDQEIAAIRALADAFPGYPLRIDPNGAWTVETSLRVADELRDVLEYFEDPTLTIDGMAAVAPGAGLPLATNMCVVAFEHIPDAVKKGAVQIILSDHHYWGGLRHTRELGAICETFGIGMSMHSNSHLGISLAAMTHVAAASPWLSYACDTHYPWNRGDDIIRPGVLEIVDGDIIVPTTPGLGIELDEDALTRQHRVFLDAGRSRRDDTGYMRTITPTYDPTLPRF
jgi:glucarate dehydratase